MNANIKAANKAKIETVIKKLEKRNMKGYYCDTSREAVETIRNLIPEDAEVSWGGSVTLEEIGIKTALKEAVCRINDPMVITDRAAAFDARRAALTCDVFLSSANAVTMNGEIVNIDATGNRVAAILFGPKKVILVVGANKLVFDERDAIDRIRNDACPANCIKLGKQTPCALTGKCGNCLSRGNTICGHLVTTRFSVIDDRIHVVLVNEWLGY